MRVAETCGRAAPLGDTEKELRHPNRTPNSNNTEGSMGTVTGSRRDKGEGHPADKRPQSTFVQGNSARCGGRACAESG